MARKPHILHVRGFNVPAENDAKFNKWYSETHIPLLMKTGEIEEATRYQRLTNDDKYPKYLTTYRIKDKEALARYQDQTSPQRIAVREELNQTWPTPGYQGTWVVQYEEIKTWKKTK
jgi:hypothetical protein